MMTPVSDVNALSADCCATSPLPNGAPKMFGYKRAAAAVLALDTP